MYIRDCTRAYEDEVHCFQGGGGTFSGIIYLFICFRLNDGSVITPSVPRKKFSVTKKGRFILKNNIVNLFNLKSQAFMSRTATGAAASRFLLDIQYKH